MLYCILMNQYLESEGGFFFWYYVINSEFETKGVLQIVSRVETERRVVVARDWREGRWGAGV